MTRAAARRWSSTSTENELARSLEERLVGQSEAIAAIVPCIRMYQANLNPAGRPVGVFLLLGPTGTGKTRTVEAIAEVMHGDPNKLLRVDCGEFQNDHEIAKLIGAPPGFIGHRESAPFFTQAKLNSSTSFASGGSPLSIVLFDEIEKASHPMRDLLLGVLDKAKLGLGDNTCVNFENSIIFMTSNLGAAKMSKAVGKGYGLESFIERPSPNQTDLQSIGLEAMKRKFSPEFINRIDRTLAYKTLTSEALTLILDQQITALQQHIACKRKDTVTLDVPARTRKFLLARGTSVEYGARELKRTIQRELMQPLANVLIDNTIPSGSVIRADMNSAGDAIGFRTS